MSTILAQSYINIIGNSNFSKEDLEALITGIAKLQKSEDTNCKPKKIIYKAPIPTLEQCMSSIRSRYNTPKQVELA